MENNNEKPECYYNDEWCEGEVIYVGGFKEYLCERCKKGEDETPDEPVEEGGDAMDYLRDWVE
jgi:hypothetical protein